MTVATNGNATGQGAGLALTTAQITAGATGVIGSDSSGNAYKQDGTAFAGGGGSIATTTAVLKGNNAGGAVAATAGTDFAAAMPTTTALLKGNNAGGAVAATAGTDFAAAMPTTTSLLKGDNAGGAAAASGVTDYVKPIAFQCAMAIGIAPGGSAVTASGANFTAGTAFLDVFGPTGNYAGAWMYFTAGAIDAGQAAGFFWVVMTSVTAGQIFNNTYTPGGSFAPPGSPTAFTTNSGNGATTGTTVAQTSHSYVVPANAMGTNGLVRYRTVYHNNNSAGAKNAFAVFGSTNFTLVSSTTAVNLAAVGHYYNRGAANKNSFSLDVNAGTSSVNTSTAVDTTANVTVAYQIKLAVATDWCFLVLASFDVVYAP